MQTNTILIHTNFFCVVARVTTTATQATSTKGMFLKLSLKNTCIFLLPSVQRVTVCVLTVTEHTFEI